MTAEAFSNANLLWQLSWNTILYNTKGIANNAWTNSLFPSIWLEIYWWIYTSLKRSIIGSLCRMYVKLESMLNYPQLHSKEQTSAQFKAK